MLPTLDCCLTDIDQKTLKKLCIWKERICHNNSHRKLIKLHQQIHDLIMSLRLPQISLT